MMVGRANRNKKVDRRKGLKVPAARSDGPHLMPWEMRTPIAAIFRSPTHTPVAPGTRPLATMPYVAKQSTMLSSSAST
jgi:hypothetical protein